MYTPKPTSYLIAFMLLTCFSSMKSFGTSFFQDQDSTIKTMPFSADDVKRTKILFDYYHHTRPNTKVGKHMVTASWVAGAGRYAWNDYVHSNTFDPVFTSLGDEYNITIGGDAFTKKVLAKHDAVLIINPDNPQVVPEVPVITDTEIKNLRSFVEDGGTLMVMINSGGPERAAEDFESVQLRKLVKSFGLDWNNDDTHYSDVPIGDRHPYFYDVPVFHYGSGCTIQILPEAKQPEVLMQVASDAGYPDRNVKGPGIVMVRHGKGKMILIGDAGSWTGNMARPWVENDRILKQLFRYAKPSKNVTVPQYKVGDKIDYKLTVSGLQAIPVVNSISQIPHTDYEFFRPREKTGMPYLEGTANVSLVARKQIDQKAFDMEANVTDFKWFDRSVSDTAQVIKFVASRQGKVTDVDAKGTAALWLSPEMPALVALTPVDGIQPGDSWEVSEWMRVPLLQGTNLSPLRNINLKVVYVRDEILNGVKCRLYRSADELWLNDLGIEVKDFLPAEEMNRVGGPYYKYFNERGGKFLFKREQWVNAETGIVVKALTQSRMLSWVQDIRKPVDASNADKDNSMILSLAQTVLLEQKR
jgi:hypothetical protein